MSKVFVVIDQNKDWSPYYPSAQVLSFEDYVRYDTDDKGAVLVINLCRSSKYLSRGYYTSLLAEAKGHRVIPTVKAINDLSRKAIYGVQIEDFDGIMSDLVQEIEEQSSSSLLKIGIGKISFKIYFGRAEYPVLGELGRKIFETFPFPLLQVQLEKAQSWSISSIKPFGLHQLEDKEEDLFAQSLDNFHHKIWRGPKSKKKFRYELAILHNPQEKLPPSSPKALKKFIKAAAHYDMRAELIERRDLPRLGEYDGLFIRETTAINHHTYVFARKAENLGLVVMDDPTSIVRCANKVYMNDLLKTLKIPGPKTFLLDLETPEKWVEAAKELGFPLVLKIPDGSFSLGVYKVSSEQDFQNKCRELFQKSVLVLAQEFMYTDFDWRIGVVGGRAIFACRYFMSQGHWQIYNHQAAKKNEVTGKFECVPPQKVPSHILKPALKACHHIGEGLYGVDIKERDGKAYIIEVNDNPNIDAGVEDLHLGDDLYLKVMEEFYRRIEER